MAKADPVLSLLGLAQRAGAVASGEFSAEKAIRAHRASLVLIAADASRPTKKHFQDMCTYRQVPMRICSDKDSLGHALGKQLRAAAAVTDPELASALIRKIDAEQTEPDEKGGAAWQK